jgi:hypothetical protein
MKVTVLEKCCVYYQKTKEQAFAFSFNEFRPVFPSYNGTHCKTGQKCFLSQIFIEAKNAENAFSLCLPFGRL